MQNTLSQSSLELLEVSILLGTVSKSFPNMPLQVIVNVLVAVVLHSQSVQAHLEMNRMPPSTG